MFHDGSMWLTLGCGPSGPADEAVDCVAVLRLVQWELVTPPVELVAICGSVGFSAAKAPIAVVERRAAAK